jgi:hypothetical protein
MSVGRGHTDGVNRELREWLRSLAGHESPDDVVPTGRSLSDEGAEYLERIARDGTLAAALTEIGANEPELAG